MCDHCERFCSGCKWEGGRHTICALAGLCLTHSEWRTRGMCMMWCMCVSVYWMNAKFDLFKLTTARIYGLGWYVALGLGHI